MLKMLGITGMSAALVIVGLISPLILIWSLNTLFPVLAIEYTLSTWAAAVFLILILSPK